MRGRESHLNKAAEPEREKGQRTQLKGGPACLSSQAHGGPATLRGEGGRPPGRSRVAESPRAALSGKPVCARPRHRGSLPLEGPARTSPPLTPGVPLATSGARPQGRVRATHRLAVGRLPVHVHAGRPQAVPVATLVVGDERHHLPVFLLVRQEDALHAVDLGRSRGGRTGRPAGALCPRPVHPARGPAPADPHSGAGQARGTGPHTV